MRYRIAEESTPQVNSRKFARTLQPWRGMLKRWGSRYCHHPAGSFHRPLSREAWRNPEAGLLTYRSSRNRLPSRSSGEQWFVKPVRSLLTVAGPCGLLTRFPFHPSLMTGTSGQTLRISHPYPGGQSRCCQSRSHPGLTGKQRAGETCLFRQPIVCLAIDGQEWRVFLLRREAI
jgi:hypothetical protein